jgi:hypothetical protein
MFAMSDVRQELIGEPKARNLISDLGALALDEGDPVVAVAAGKLLDVGEG